MSSFTGKSGYILFDDTVFNGIGILEIQNYTVDFIPVIEPYSAMSSGGFEKAVLAGFEWTATIESSYDDSLGMDLSNFIDAQIGCVFHTGDQAFTGTAYVEGSPTVNVRARNTVSWNVIGVGPLEESS